MVIRKGTLVKWKNGSMHGRGKVTETFARKVTKSIKGADITRYGQKENKALHITSSEGEEFLKLENEVERDTDEQV